jgi:hypothetical protein
MRGQPLSAAEVAEGRLYIVGKKSNVLVANFYISQILAIDAADLQGALCYREVSARGL